MTGSHGETWIRNTKLVHAKGRNQILERVRVWYSMLASVLNEMSLLKVYTWNVLEKKSVDRRYSIFCNLSKCFPLQHGKINENVQYKWRTTCSFYTPQVCVMRLRHFPTGLFGKYKYMETFIIRLLIQHLCIHLELRDLSRIDYHWSHW